MRYGSKQARLAYSRTGWRGRVHSFVIAVILPRMKEPSVAQAQARIRDASPGFSGKQRR
jgi:hypothetical protein